MNESNAAAIHLDPITPAPKCYFDVGDIVYMRGNPKRVGRIVALEQRTITNPWGFKKGELEWQWFAKVIFPSGMGRRSRSRFQDGWYQATSWPTAMTKAIPVLRSYERKLLSLYAHVEAAAEIPIEETV